MWHDVSMEHEVKPSTQRNGVQDTKALSNSIYMTSMIPEIKYIIYTEAAKAIGTRIN